MRLTLGYPALGTPPIGRGARFLLGALGLLGALLLTACGADIAYPSGALEENSLGGAVFFDRDGDGLPGPGDQPVAATIGALGVGGDGGNGSNGSTGSSGSSGSDEATTFAPDPNTPPTTTERDGSFILNYRFRVERPGVAVSLSIPVADTESFGNLDTFVALTPDSARNNVALGFEPQACDDCVEVPPDLVPIVAWDQIDPEARSALQPATSTTGGQGLLPTETWFVENADGRTLLRFSSVTANLGDGPLDVIAERVDLGGFTPTWQRIWTEDWNYRDVRSGEFVFHDDHDHVHFDAFERYRLLDAQGRVVAESAKVSFCLRDSVRVTDDPLPTIGIFGSGDCGERQQAINPGFADHYNQFLPDQWIDVTGVPSGNYTVEITIDPLDLIIEADETNNTATFEVTLS